MQTDVSRRVIEPLLCPCGHQFETVTWTILDIDLHPEIRDDPYSIDRIECPKCGAITQSSLPLLLLHGHPDLMIVAFHSSSSPAMNSSEIAGLLGFPAEPPPGLVLEAHRLLSPEVLLVPRDIPALDALTRRAVELGGADAEGLRQLVNKIGTMLQYRALHEAFFRSFDLGSLENLERIIAEFPVVLENRFCEFLRLHRDGLQDPTDIDYRLLSIRIDLFCRIAAGQAVDSAWEGYADGMASYLVGAVQPEIQRLTDQLANGIALESRQARIQLYERAIYISKVLNNVQLEAELSSNLGIELINRDEFFTADAGREIAQYLFRARELSRDEAPDIYARASSNLALLLTRAPLGDRSTNQEHAIALFEECLLYFTEESHPDEWALCSTNLAIVYVDREAGNRQQNISRAVFLCENALRVRSPERNPLDWGYTVANLAYALRSDPRMQEDESVREAHLARAAALYRRVFDVLADSNADLFCAGVMQNRASVLIDLVKLRIEQNKRRRAEVLIDSETGGLTLHDPSIPAPSPAELIRRAELFVLNPSIFAEREPPLWAKALVEVELTNEDRTILEEAKQNLIWTLNVELYRQRGTAGLTYRLLADISRISGDDEDDRMRYLQEAVSILRKHGMDSQLLEAYCDMGQSYASRKMWVASAEYYYLAVQLLNLIAARRQTAEAQSREIANYSKLAEWAAYALVKSGNLEEAVLTIENARARALGLAVKRDEADLGYLMTIDARLAERFVRVRDAIRYRPATVVDVASGPDEVSLDEATSFSDVVEEIRRVPGLEKFPADASNRDVLAASRTNCPIVYLISTAAGTVSILVRGSDDTAAAPYVLISDSDTTSGDLVSCLLRYSPAGVSGILSPTGSGLEAALEEATVLLGNAFGQDLYDYLKASEIEEVILVPAGILGSYPLGSAIVKPRNMGTENSGIAQFLCDFISVSVAPSAVVADGCRRRIDRMGQRVRYFAGVGDPEQLTRGRRLAWAEAEIRALQGLYGASDADVKVGADATRAFFMDAASRASHYHLACHGRSDLEDPMQSAVYMADGPITVEKIRDSGIMDCRIIVVSACESGRAGINDAANEFVGLPGEMIASGASAVVASLWPVDDLASCVLMIRFHEELAHIESGGVIAGGPPLALRRAQIWIRDQTGRQIAAYLKERLGKERFAQFKDGGSGRYRGLLGISRAKGKPFSHPRYWAPFVVFGV